jgi:protein phosphatase
MKNIHKHACVVMVGITQSGKSAWAHAHFPDHEILSVEQLRQEITGRSDNFTQDRWCWQELYRRAHMRLEMGQRVVIDSTNLKREDLNHWHLVCEELDVQLVFVHMNTPDAQVDLRARMCGIQDHVLQKQRQMVNQTLRLTQHVRHISQRWVTPDQIRVIEPQSVLPSRLLVVGDVHGDIKGMMWAANLAAQTGQHLVWLGDVVDYGVHNLACVELAYRTVNEGRAHMIWGNHEKKIDRWIQSDWGNRFQGRLSDANWMTVRQIQALSIRERNQFWSKWQALSSWSTQHVHRGTWCMTHGAAHELMWHTQAHRLSGPAGNMAYFGEVHDAQPQRPDGYPNRTWRWVDAVPEHHTVVVGHDYLDRVNHVPVIKQNVKGGTVMCIDTGNSKGGRLTALSVDTDNNQSHVHQYSSELL